MYVATNYEGTYIHTYIYCMYDVCMYVMYVRYVSCIYVCNVYTYEGTYITNITYIRLIIHTCAHIHLNRVKMSHKLFLINSSFY